MPRFQAFCPSCQQANVYHTIPQPGAVAICIGCGLQFIPNAGAQQPPVEAQLAPLNQAPHGQQPLHQAPVPQKPVGQKPFPGSSVLPAGNSGSRVGLFVGLGAGLLVLVGVVLVYFLSASRPDVVEPRDVRSVDAMSSQPAPLSQANLKPASAPTLAYNWPNRQVECRFTVQTSIDRRLLIVEGRTIYEGSREDPATMAADELAMDRDGSGTGFVVHPEGILVTCAHVVEGATKITVRLGEAEHQARVLAMNTEDDLALLKIEAEGLPFLRLSDSSQLALAEEIRVIGFPLSSTLGESVKVTRGSLAGFIERTSGRILQLDASINPGNSGGPVVNGSGHVVGVASAILIGAEIQKVGFGVPSQKVMELLRSRNIPHVPTTNERPLDGPTLARRVTPSVAILKVKYGMSGVGLGKPKIVHYRGRYQMFTAEARTPRVRSSFGTLVSDSGKLLLDSRGDILHDASRSDKELPLMLGTLGQVGIELLPADGRKSWEEVDVAMIPQVESKSGLMLDGPRYSPYSRRFGRYLEPPTSSEVTLHPAVSKTHYRVLGETADILRIEKNFELKTVTRDEELPFLVIEARGVLEFDKRAGLPKKLEFKGVYKKVKQGRQLSLPFNMNFEYRSLTGASLRSASSSTANSKATPRAPVRKVTDTVPSVSPRSRVEKDTNGLNKFDPNN